LLFRVRQRGLLWVVFFAALKPNGRRLIQRLRGFNN
jgi:hypothetical protein